MKRVIAAAVAATVLCGAAPAFAEYSVSGGYSVFSDSGTNPGAVRGSFSATNGLLGGEGEVFFGISGDSGVRATSGVVGYGRVEGQVAPNLLLFARAGYGTMSFENGALEGGAYGVGATYYFSGDHGIRVDYTNFDSVDVWGVSYSHRFK